MHSYLWKTKLEVWISKQNYFICLIRNLAD